MKKFLLALFLMTICSAYAAPLVTIQYLDDQGAPVNACATSPLPVIADIASATFTASGSLDTRVTSDTAILGFSQTTDVTVTGTSQLLASMSSRLFISIQNKAATESCYINPGGTTATPGFGFEIKAGDTYERDFGPLISLPIVCTTTANIAYEQDR